MNSTLIPAATAIAPVVDTLSGKAEQFAVDYARHGDASKAYRDSYDVSPATSRATVNKRAWELRHSTPVAARIREIQAVYAEGTVISVRARKEKLQRIVEADPSELVAIAGSACRYCWSENGGYQFRDEAEMGRAVDRYMRSLSGPKPQQPPDTSGGIGYKGDREPNEFCKQCEGAGLTHTVITPTAHLSQAGKALYKGARQKAHARRRTARLK